MGFEMTVEKPKPKQSLRPITTGTNSVMNQSQFLAITCNSLEAREKSRVHRAIGFGFASRWLKNWRDSFKHEGALYKEVLPGKIEAHLSVTVKVRGSNSKWRAI